MLGGRLWVINLNCTTEIIWLIKIYSKIFVVCLKCSEMKKRVTAAVLQRTLTHVATQYAANPQHFLIFPMRKAVDTVKYCTSRRIYWYTTFTLALHEYAIFFMIPLSSVTFKNEHMAIFYLIALITRKEHKCVRLRLPGAARGPRGGNRSLLHHCCTSLQIYMCFCGQCLTLLHTIFQES